MTIVRLVNTTTSLRVDATLEREFYRMADPAFLAAVESQHAHAYLDVWFVRRSGLPSQGDADRIPDTDFLGVYFSHYRSTHHPVIMISPERVLDACQAWQKRIGDSLPFAQRFPTLLHAVIIHELSHYLMDEIFASSDCCRMRPWTEVAGWLNENALDQTDKTWADELIPDGEAENWMQGKLKAQAERCDTKARTVGDWRKRNSTLIAPLEDLCRSVEESLANAFMLRQRIGQKHNAALRVFIDSQSAPYKAGLRWHGDLGELLQAASAWRDFKSEFIGIGGRKWSKAPARQREVLERLVRSLSAPEEVRLPSAFT